MLIDKKRSIHNSADVIVFKRKIDKHCDKIINIGYVTIFPVKPETNSH